MPRTPVRVRQVMKKLSAEWKEAKAGAARTPGAEERPRGSAASGAVGGFAGCAGIWYSPIRCPRPEAESAGARRAVLLTVGDVTIFLRNFMAGPCHCLARWRQWASPAPRRRSRRRARPPLAAATPTTERFVVRRQNCSRSTTRQRRWCRRAAARCFCGYSGRHQPCIHAVGCGVPG